MRKNRTKLDIELITYKDVSTISSILKTSKALNTNQVAKNIIDHIKSGLAIKGMLNGKIVAIWCSIEYTDFTSLSFFYTDTSIRRKLCVLEFFMYGYNKINKTKPIIITAKNTDGFSRYFKHLGNDIYQFIGIR